MDAQQDRAAADILRQLWTALLKSARGTEAGKRVHVMLKQGDILLKLRRGDEAETCFRKALELDGFNPQAHLGLCRRFLQQRKYEQAAESARDSLGALFHNPKGHYYHGVALRHCGQTDTAIRALETALSQNPNFPSAHAQLAMICGRDLGDDPIARFYRESAQQVRRSIRQQRRGTSRTPEVPVGPRGIAVARSARGDPPHTSSAGRTPDRRGLGSAAIRHVNDDADALGRRSADPFGSGAQVRSKQSQGLLRA